MQLAILLFLITAVFGQYNNNSQQSNCTNPGSNNCSPSYYTKLRKVSNYKGYFQKETFPNSYIPQGIRSLTIPLSCGVPYSVFSIEVYAWDWYMPPLVQIDYNDNRVYVVRQDKNNWFRGQAVVQIKLQCGLPYTAKDVEESASGEDVAKAMRCGCGGGRGPRQI